MSPLPSTRMIPPGWSTHHQRVVVGAFNAKARVTDPARATPGTFDPATGSRSAPTPHVVAGGTEDTVEEWRGGVPVRVQALDDDRAVEHAEQGITVRLYLVQLPANVPDIETGYRVEVVEALNDAHLVGESLEVTDVLHGSERFTRDVVAVHNQAPRMEA